MEHTTEETEANVEPLIGRAVLRTGKRHVTIQSRRRIWNKSKGPIEKSWGNSNGKSSIFMKMEASSSYPGKVGKISGLEDSKKYFN